jgi:hypothetical protein
LAQFGHTNSEIAQILDIPSSTFDARIGTNQALQDALKRGKQIPNRQVENALFKRALGYETTEITESDGKPVKKVIKHVVPSVSAEELWLRNRDPEKWNTPTAVNMKLTLLDKVKLAQDS